MPRTPDRSPGLSDEEGTVYEPTVAATAQGEVRYDGTSFSLFDASGEFDPRGGAGSDIKDLKVSASDTTAGFLEDKLQAGNAVDLKTLNPAGNEKVEIAVGYRRQFLLMGG